MTTTELRSLIIDAVTRDDFRRATFAGAQRIHPSTWVRVTIRPVKLRGERQLQFAQFDGRKTVTKNYSVADVTPAIESIATVGYAGVHLSTGAEEIDIRTTKKGKIEVGRRPARPSKAVALEHNRVKDVPLPEGRADRVLEVMGILTGDGRVRAAMRPKFTQINEFLKQLRHAIDDADLASLGRPIEMLDCGCGSSYLTIAAHHYLNDVLNIPAKLLGVDVNDALIRKSTERAGRLGAEGLSFACAAIGEATARADVVFALHACDTATDDALALAVRCGAKLILSVPCCHHHLNQQIGSDVLRPMLRHGILSERTADIVTDAFRALALRIMGYRTEVVEFVSPEHTARNLMIRAVAGPPVGEASFVAEYRAMKEFWGVTPYIERMLGDVISKG